jgi:hypothetical protein
MADDDATALSEAMLEQQVQEADLEFFHEEALKEAGVAKAISRAKVLRRIKDHFKGMCHAWRRSCVDANSDGLKITSSGIDGPVRQSRATDESIYELDRHRDFTADGLLTGLSTI